MDYTFECQMEILVEDLLQISMEDLLLIFVEDIFLSLVDPAIIVHSYNLILLSFLFILIYVLNLGIHD